MNYIIGKPKKKVTFNEVAVEYRGRYWALGPYYVNLKNVEDEEDRIKLNKIPYFCEEAFTN